LYCPLNFSIFSSYIENRAKEVVVKMPNKKENQANHTLNLVIAIITIFGSILVTVFAIGYYWGKIEQRITDLEEKVRKLEMAKNLDLETKETTSEPRDKDGGATILGEQIKSLERAASHDNALESELTTRKTAQSYSLQASWRLMTRTSHAFERTKASCKE
jgi:hypothetical protein